MTDIGVPEGAIAIGPEITFLTVPRDAPTIAANGLKGVMVLTHTTTISFFEQLMEGEEGKLMGRHVMNVTMPNDQFCAVAEMLAKVASDIRAAGTSAPTPELAKP